ncbi:phosphopentomutase [Rubrimonas cliftonensis]|uniref:Phosphopentomutase n=1 Tax=Rubrimonas cliftonensis TaxID=89524 RepID=A0A1H4AK86_9RHOB|nr:phosphopentomutase [Rubrimonas cliftonensis]SEA36383.1 phosphopentomutase [Rubrimonas cliftonensis]
MARVALVVLDSVGVGGAPDAAAFGDAGADTLGHIAEACAVGRGDRDGLRAGPLSLPNLDRLGLGAAAKLATGRAPPGLSGDAPAACFGAGVESSRGKDTPSGHWELAGAPVDFDWGYFPQTAPCFPPELVAALCAECGLPGILGDRHASGTEIMAALGAAHVETGSPICYTSVDSVFQIAAHEEAFGLARLYAVCEAARRLVDPLNIGRVIARPFTGPPGAFRRTANRRDYAIPPHLPTLCDRARDAGREVIGVGKIGDIFAHRGVSETRKGPDDAALVERLVAALAEGPERAKDGALIFVNLVEFDSLYGHRRDAPGYAAALERFDAALPRIEAALGPGDLLILTADHGNDPTWAGTDHTREMVPILCAGPGLAPRALGRRRFADVGETAAAALGLARGEHGESFL